MAFGICNFAGSCFFRPSKGELLPVKTPAENHTGKKAPSPPFGKSDQPVALRDLLERPEVLFGLLEDISLDSGLEVKRASVANQIYKKFLNQNKEIKGRHQKYLFEVIMLLALWRARKSFLKEPLPRQS
jgi:hypothetical protein